MVAAKQRKPICHEVGKLFQRFCATIRIAKFPSGIPFLLRSTSSGPISEDRITKMAVEENAYQRQAWSPSKTGRVMETHVHGAPFTQRTRLLAKLTNSLSRIRKMTGTNLCPNREINSPTHAEDAGDANNADVRNIHLAHLTSSTEYSLSTLTSSSFPNAE